MTIDLSKAAITETSIAKAALRQKLRDGGIEKSRVAFALESVARCPEDRALLDVCYGFMQEISKQKQDSLDGSWRWEHQVRPFAEVPSAYLTTCEIVGCWLRDDRFYVNQNHEDWR